MRKAALLLAAAVLLGCPLPAHAGGAHWLGYDVGAGIPSGFLGDFAETGPNVGVSYTYMFTPYTGLGAEIEYYRWRNTAEIEEAYRYFYGDGAQYKQSDWQTTVHGVLALPIGRVTPYAKAGVGYYAAKHWMAVDGEEYWLGDQWLGHLTGGGLNLLLRDDVTVGASAAYHRYGDGARHHKIVYWSGALQLSWKMPWSTKVAP